MTIEGTGNQREARSREAFTKRIRDSIKQTLLDIPETLDLESQKKQLLTRLTKRIPDILPEYAGELEQLMSDLEALPVTDREELVGQATPRLVSFYTSAMSLEELQTRLSKYWAEFHGRTYVNEILSYDLHSPTEVNIHVATLFTLSPDEMIERFEEGLRRLAQQLQTDQSLAQIELIRGRSWVVDKYPRLVQKLGFMIDDIKDEEEGDGALASMSRKDFIRLYGN